jgi:urease accessory protein
MNAAVDVETAVSAGWQADLDLAFQRQDNRTAMTLNRHRGPLQVQKALYPEGGEICHVTVLHPPGGVAAGDQLEVRALLNPQAQALLTTPGATKWYRSEGAQATQRLKFTLAADSELEWLPRENILFDGVDVSLELDVELQPGAKYLGWDIFCFGRRASGETWKHGKLRMRSRIRCERGLLWSEIASVDGSSEFSASPMGLAGYSVCGTLVAARCCVDSLLRELRAVPSPPHCRVGITVLPEVLVARYLGDSGEDAFAWYTALWTLIRPSALGRGAQPPRVWAC